MLYCKTLRWDTAKVCVMGGLKGKGRVIMVIDSDFDILFCFY